MATINMRQLKDGVVRCPKRRAAENDHPLEGGTIFSKAQSQMTWRRNAKPSGLWLRDCGAEWKAKRERLQ